MVSTFICTLAFMQHDVRVRHLRASQAMLPSSWTYSNSCSHIAYSRGGPVVVVDGHRHSLDAECIFTARPGLVCIHQPGVSTCSCGLLARLIKALMHHVTTDRCLYACRFERIDCLDDEPVLLQLLHEVRANKVILDIGGDRGLPALTSIVDALQRVSIDWIFVKSQLMLEAAVLHLAKHFPVHRAVSQTQSLSSLSPSCFQCASTTAMEDLTSCLPEKTGSVAIVAIRDRPAQAPVLLQQQQHQQERQRLDDDCCQRGQDADTLVSGSLGKAEKRPCAGTQRVAKKQRGCLVPPQVLWRWKASDMPRAWDLTARIEVQREGLVREGLAVVVRSSEWWEEQV